MDHLIHIEALNVKPEALEFAFLCLLVFFFPALGSKSTNFPDAISADFRYILAWLKHM